MEVLPPHNQLYRFLSNIYKENPKQDKMDPQKIKYGKNQICIKQMLV